MRAVRTFIPKLEASAAEGRVVDLINMSSITGHYLYGYFAVYAAVKDFVSHLTRHLRMELGPRSIRVSMPKSDITDPPRPARPSTSRSRKTLPNWWASWWPSLAA